MHINLTHYYPFIDCYVLGNIYITSTIFLTFQPSLCSQCLKASLTVSRKFNSRSKSLSLFGHTMGQPFISFPPLLNNYVLCIC